MGQISFKNTEKLLMQFFGEDLKLRCSRCGKTFKNSEEFMKHEHDDKKEKKCGR